MKDEAADIVRVSPMLADFIPEYINSRKQEIVILESSLRAGDFAAIAKPCHDIKGHAKGYGFLKLQALAFEMEQCGRKDADNCLRLLHGWKDHFARIQIRVEEEA